ncbi:ABC transporter ATP-binding protein [candidate division KSB1 bacterium]|nr:ABC transporter ATP-binding protein [candidate division KSB1 bacterium]
MNESIIKINKLGLTVNGKSILREVNLRITTGDYVAILGPNGAGKTSLLKCLIRYHHKFSGMIEIFGHSIYSLSQRSIASMISYVPQLNGTTFPFTVEEFVLMGRYPYFSPFATIHQLDRQAVDEAMQHAGVIQFAGRSMMTLSGGERQLVLIAAALAQGAKVLLLDEPTTYLDPMHKSRLYALLQRLNTTLRMTIVLVTHDINQAALHANRMVAMKNGTIAFDGAAAEIMRKDALETIFEHEFTFIKHPENEYSIILPES